MLLPLLAATAELRLGTVTHVVCLICEWCVLDVDQRSAVESGFGVAEGSAQLGISLVTVLASMKSGPERTGCCLVLP